MVDRSHERANDESRAEMAALVARLTPQQLRTDLGEGWTALSHLAHLGFWDRWQAERWRSVLAGSWRADDISVLVAEDLANEALSPYWAAIETADVPALALEAAVVVDELIAQAPDALVTELDASPNQFLLHRHRHRREHLGWIRRDDRLTSGALGDRTVQPSGQRTVRVTVVQSAPAAFDREQSIDRVADLTARAAADGAQLVVFPEAFVGGYPKRADFGARVGSRTAAGREWFRRYHDGAMDVPGLSVDRLAGISRTARVYLVVGVIERERGTLYCTVLFLGPDGRLLGKHRKLMPTAMERLIWGFGDGSTIPVIDAPFGRIGAVICWENYMPQLRLAMYGQGVELYCAPTVDDRETWLPTMRHVALEGRCFVLSACQFARRSDYPADYPIESSGGDEVVIAGGSCIVDPLGQVLAGPARGDVALLSADLDLGQIARGNLDLDVVGHYARPDVFRLLVDRRAQAAVSFSPEELPPTPSAPEAPPADNGAEEPRG